MFKYNSEQKCAPVSEIMSTVQDKEISINMNLLEKLYKLPADGRTLEELEIFGDDSMVEAYLK